MKHYAAYALASAFVAAPASAAPLYFNNFDAPATVAAGVGVVGLTNAAPTAAQAGPWNAAGWAGNYADNRTSGNPAAASTLTFTNLPGHTQISVAFLFGFLESWDSTNGSNAPDLFRVQADGVDLVANLTSDNTSGNVEFFDGGVKLFENVQLNSNFGFSDTLVNMAGAPKLTFNHSGSTLVLSFQAYGGGWQGGNDEGWGIDNLAIGFTPAGAVVPEPADWALMLAGFSLAGAALRRRRLIIA